MMADPRVPQDWVDTREPWLTGRKKLIIGGAVVALAMFYFAFQAFQGAAEYFYSVEELKSQSGALAGETLRVRGKLLQGSFERVAGTDEAEFILVDENNDHLQVTHAGVVPNLFFNPHSEIILQGAYHLDGVFTTRGDPLIKCPTKFQEFEAEGQESPAYGT